MADGEEEEERYTSKAHPMPSETQTLNEERFGSIEQRASDDSFGKNKMRRKHLAEVKTEGKKVKDTHTIVNLRPIY